MAKLITTLNVGDKIKLGSYKVEGSTTLPIIWKVIDKNHTGYPANSVTLLTDTIIDLRGFDAKEPTNADANRVKYGNNRYKTSNLRQWLNSGGAANTWWAAQNISDGTTNTNNKDATPNDIGMSQPTGYSDIPGFINNFTTLELSNILNTTLTVGMNTITDGGGSEVVTDKVFLLSNTELGLTNENGIVEGSIFSIFSSNANRVAYATSQCISNTLSTSKPANTSSGWYWWLRTPSSGYSFTARMVGSGGTLNHNLAYNGNRGVRPALNLSSSILVSDTVDVDGAYVIQWNATPTISGTNENLGNMNATFTQDFSVNDTDVGNTLTITTKINDTILNTIVGAVRGQIYTIDLVNQWASLPLGTHSISIIVDDGVGGTSTRTHTFTKVSDRIEFTLKNPILTDTNSDKITISAVVVVPEGATLNISVCNNGFDAEPTWEDVTEAFINKQAHTFANLEKTASDWGINVWFTLLKGSSISNIEVKAFGFSFE